MQAKDLKQGMWVECPKGVVEIIEVDPAHNSAIVESMHDHSRSTVNCDDIQEQPQLHIGCNIYY